MRATIFALSALAAVAVAAGPPLITTPSVSTPARATPTATSALKDHHAGLPKSSGVKHVGHKAHAGKGRPVRRRASTRSDADHVITAIAALDTTRSQIHDALLEVEADYSLTKSSSFQRRLLFQLDLFKRQVSSLPTRDELVAIQAKLVGTTTQLEASLTGCIATVRFTVKDLNCLVGKFPALRVNAGALLAEANIFITGLGIGPVIDATAVVATDGILSKLSGIRLDVCAGAPALKGFC